MSSDWNANLGSSPRWHRARRSSPSISPARVCSRISSTSAFTSWATAAPPASGTQDRCPSRSRARVNERGLVAVSVLSGNRNFEGRISPDARANYLASPPLVVAYALAGHRRLGPDQRAAGPGSRWKRRVPARHLARPGGGRRPRRRSCQPGPVRLEVLGGVHRIRRVARHQHAPSPISIDGTRIPPTSRSRRSSSAWDPTSTRSSR